ncbi:hypothetical protein Dimus_035015 [Dionaea muscipula]
MGKIQVEVCLISARGLRRSALWKLQWFAVGWIDPNDKYCTKIVSSGNGNPIWKTKFEMLVDTLDKNFQDLALHVEVYSREPLFLRVKLEGTTTVTLNEFLSKRDKVSHGEQEREEHEGHEGKGSFKLRRKSRSNEARGFVDLSVRISDQEKTRASFPAGRRGFDPNEESVIWATEAGLMEASTQGLPRMPHDDNGTTRVSVSYPIGDASSHPAEDSAEPQTPPSPPPPPPPPSNVGFIPTLFPPSRGTGRGGGSDAAAAAVLGVGAGALAAGAMIFGDDFLSGFDHPVGLQDGDGIYPP